MSFLFRLLGWNKSFSSTSDIGVDTSSSGSSSFSQGTGNWADMQMETL